MKILIISPKNRTIYNFRGDLIKTMIEAGHSVLVTGPNQDDIESVLALGVSFREIPVSKNGTNIFSDLKYMKKLKKLMKEEKPGIVFSYTVKPVVYGSIAAKRAGIKNINSMITGGGYAFTAKSLKARIIGFFVRLLYKRGLAYSHNVIFQNQDDLEEFVSKKLVKKEKCSVIHGSGVNMQYFSRQPFAEGIRFLMISRLLKGKGVLEYLAAAKRIKQAYPTAEFGLLGKYETTMQDAISEEVIEKYIQDGTIVRYEETADVRPYYQQCHVYVLPSYREGTPRTVLEAMASGRAIITTDSNGCRDTVIDGKNGFLVPVGDVDHLAETMQYFLANPNEIKTMGQESYHLCKEKYDVNKVNARLLDIMQVD